MTEHAVSKYIPILTRSSFKNEKKRVLQYFLSHQSKTVHAFIVDYSTTLAFFVYAGKSRSVLE